jgi:hypothetical protein
VALEDEQDQQTITFFFDHNKETSAHLYEGGLSGAAIANWTR